jgi:competence protein ComEC
MAAIVFALSAFYLQRSRIRITFGVTLCLLFIGGAWVIQVRDSRPSSLRDITRFATGEEVIVTGHVTREGTPQEKEFGEGVQKIDLETEQIVTGEKESAIQAGLRLTIFRKSKKQDIGTASDFLGYGQRVRFPAKLSLPRNFNNPGSFDYEGYLADSGVFAIGSVKISDIEVLRGFTGNRLEWWRILVHRSLIRHIHELWPPEQAALVDTIMLGDDTFLGRSTRTEFQRTGTYHVLVVSGLKVGVLALVTFGILRRLRVNDFVASAITVLLTTFYAVLTDVGTPVWRATLMLILYLATRLLYRNRSILNTIGAAALLLLLIDPSQLFGASFQLSFLCVLIIGGIGSPILERTTKPLSRALRNLESTSYDLALSPNLVQLRLDLRMIASRLQRFLGRRAPLFAFTLLGRVLILVTDFILISILLQAGFVLPMACYFHRATIVSLPANILVVPLTEVIMVASSCGIAFGYISLIAAKVPVFVTDISLRIAEATVHWMGGMRIADARVPTPELWIALLACAALVLAMILSRRKKIFVWGSLVAIAATALWISVIPPRPRFRAQALEVTAIDVGQGDSLLLVTPAGRTMLIDAGGLPAWMHSDLDIGEDVVSPYLWSRGISHLDTVAITHAHADHLGGMASVLSNFHPRELWLGVNSPAPELQRIVEEANDLGIPVVLHASGDRAEIGGAEVRILAPARDAVSQSSRPNDTSLVMKVSFGMTSALLEGDAERKEENFVSQEDSHADLLKVAHHGSATSTAEDFLASVHPRFAVISVGARNLYGHPRREVLDRLAKAKVSTYRTDIEGAVSFYLDGKNVIPDAWSLR